MCMPSAMMSAVMPGSVRISANDAGIAVAKWPHGIEGVRRVAGAGIDCGAGGFKIRVRVPHAHEKRRASNCLG